MLSIERARAEFASEVIYLNTATLGLPPRRALVALDQALTAWRNGTANPVDYDEPLARARQTYAQLVGVSAGLVAVGSQVSTFAGLVAVGSQVSTFAGLVAQWLPVGGEVLVAEGEFTSLTFPFFASGHQVREVALDRIADEVRPETALVAVSARMACVDIFGTEVQRGSPGGRPGSVRKVLIAVAGVSLLALPSCGNESSPSSPGVSLAGKSYLSTAVNENGKPKQLPAKIQLTFTDDGRLIAKAGCNQLQAPVATGDGKLAVKELSTTEMGCDPARHATDDWLAKFLQSGPAWRLVGNKLTVSTSSTTIDLTDRATAEPNLPLEGTKWILSTVIAGDSASHQTGSEQAYLTINGERVTGSTGCNELQGKVAQTAGKLTFGEIATTRRACTGEPGKLEQSLLGALKGEVTYQIESNHLRLRPTTPAGPALDFTATR